MNFVGSFNGTTFTPDEPATYTPPSGSLYEGFDDGTYDVWTPTGTAFGSAPATLLPVGGGELDITTTLNAGSAANFGLEVDTGTYSDGRSQYTKIGYDRRGGEVYIDRGASGYTTFGAGFAPVQSAELPLGGGNSITLHILLDASSVEVFANGGQVTRTDQIHPDQGSADVAAYANGGTAVITSLRAYQVGSIRP